MRIWGKWGWSITAIVLLGACSDSPVTTTTTEPPSTVTVAASTSTLATTTTAPEVTTTTTETVEVLLPNNDVDDPTQAIVAIFEYVSYIATTPERARELLHLIYARTCDCYDRILADFDTYVANGWVQNDDGIEVTNATVNQEFENGDVLMEVTYTYSPQFVVDRAGNRIRLENDEWTDLVALIGLEIGDDGRWRVGVLGLVGEGL